MAIDTGLDARSTENSTQEISFPVTGMTCASCVRRVEKALLKVPGVQNAAVNLATEKATVTFDTTTATPDMLRTAVEKAGYGVRDMPTLSPPPAPPQTIVPAVQETATGGAISLPIEGMTCASCVRRVERALQKVDGVSEASVNLATEKATIAFDPARADLAQLTSAIENAGYKVGTIATAPASSAVAGSPPADPVDHRAIEREHEIADLKRKWQISLGVGLVMMALMYAPLPIGMDVLAPLLLIAATIVQFWAGRVFYTAAWAAGRHGGTNMNTLVAIGTSVAYAYSAFVTLWPALATRWGFEHHLYYETAIIVIALILMGRWMEARAKSQTAGAIKALVGLQARTARIIRNGLEVDVPIEQVLVNDLVRVRPGEKVPVDGVIAEGTSAIEESMITGESMPVEKSIGATVIGSTLNKTGSFVFKATRVGRDTTLAQIVRLVEDAQGSKAPMQRLADTISSYFVPVILVVAALTFVGWLLLGPEPRLTLALQAAIAVLIIACPCALGLATPTAIMVGTGKAAENGILIRGGEALEQTRRINTIVLDKTGTLTLGKPAVTQVIATNGIAENELLRLAAAAEVGSEHPLGEAIVRQASALGLDLPKSDVFQAIAGGGIQAQIEGREIVLGNRALMDRLGIRLNGLVEQAQTIASKGATPMYVAVAGQSSGLIAVADTVRPESVEAVAQMKALGLDVWMITGDNRATAEAIARDVGITNILAEVLPDQKAEKVRELQGQGRVVAMVGDGINDSPALAQSDLGIAIGTGTDVAMAASDITLIGGDLRNIVTAIALSRKTVGVIKQGLFWAFAYNVILIPVAMGALYPFFHIMLNPVLAAAAMAMSSVSVVTNALRLRRFRRPASAEEILHPSIASRVGEYAYLVGIALIALGVGVAALWFAQSPMGSAQATNGMAMPASAISAEAAGVRADLALSAAAVAGQPVRLTYRLANGATGAPITDVVISHEQPMHLIVVRDDLAGFQHVHPQPTGNPGELAYDLTLPAAGRYYLAAEFTRANGQDIVKRDEIVATGATSAAATIAENRSPKTSGGVRVAFGGATTLTAGRETRLTFRAEDPATGAPLRNLQPYLGAPAHVVVLSADGQRFAHVHGEAVGAAATAVPAGGKADDGHGHSDVAGSAGLGPEFAATYTFATPGLYKIWGQFQSHDGKVITADYVVRVQ